MKKGDSLLKNLSKGISTRLRKFFLKDAHEFRINPLYEKYLKHLPGNRIHSHKLFGNKTYFRAGPDYLNALTEIFVERVYDQVLPDNALVIDCGAHIGMSVLFVKRACPTARIICFEPDKSNFELLMKNIQSHALKNVEAHNKAVWTAETTLNFDTEASMSSRIIEGGSEGDEVATCRLFDFLDQEVDFLKIDIEGAEFAVLKDIEPRLNNVARMFIEYHGLFQQNHELIEMLQIVSNQGFQFYITEAGPVYPHPFTGVRGNSIYDVQLNIFCMRTEG